jgi:hypothetical protein
MEFAALSRHTGKREYFKKAIRVYEILDKLPKVDGLYPLYVDNRQERFTNQHLSIGAMGDSFYECVRPRPFASAGSA